MLAIALLALSGLGAALVVGRASASAYTITVSASPNPVPADATSVTLTATISPAPAAGAMLKFWVNGAPLSVSAYAGSCTTPNPYGGACVDPTTDTATATYSGFLPGTTNSVVVTYAHYATSPTYSLIIDSATPDSTNTVLSPAGTTSATLGSPVTLQATVTDTVTGHPVSDGTVTFYDENTTPPTQLGTQVNGGDAAGVYTLTWSNFSVGLHNIEANFTGPTGIASSVGGGVTLHITSPSLAATSTVLAVNPQAITTSGSATLVATVTNGVTGQPVSDGTVTFYDENTTPPTQLGQPVQSNGNGNYETTIGSLAAGQQTIQANFTALDEAPSRGSASITVLANLANSTTALSATNTTLLTGESTMLTATTSWSVAGVTPTGTTTFYANGQPIATVPVNPSGVATYTYTPPAGVISVTAAYNGDAAIASSPQSSAVSLDVANKDTTTITTSFTPGTPSAGDSVQLSAVVVPGTSTSGTPGGTVAFYLNSVSSKNLLCTATLVKGAASCATTALPAGTDSVIASYPGDSAHLASTATFAVPVTKAASTTSVTASPSPAQSGQSVTLTAQVSGDQPTGTVSFSDGTTALCSATVGSDGTASCATTALPVGNNETITASYAGDDNNRSSTGTTTVTVTPSAPDYHCASFGGLWGFSSQTTDSPDSGPTCEPWLLNNPSPAQTLTLASGTSGTVSITYADESAIGTGALAPSAALESSNGGYLQQLAVSVTPEASYFGRQHDLLSVTVPSSLGDGTYEVLLTAFDSDGDVDQNTWSVVVTSATVPPVTDCTNGGQSNDEHSDHRNQGRCETMLYNPSSPGGVVVGAGSTTSLSISYQNETPLASGANAPSAVIMNASGAVVANAVVTVVSGSSRGDGNRVQNLLSIAIPSTLAAGNDVVRLTVTDQEGDVDQYDWPLVVVASSGEGWGGPWWGAPVSVGAF